MKQFRLKLWLSVVAMVLLSAPAYSQYWPLPAKTPNTDVRCTECPNALKNKLTKGYSAPITTFTGRFLDSTMQRPLQQPFRTGRVDGIHFMPALNRVYFRVGGAVFAYAIDTFFTRLNSGESLTPASQFPVSAPGYGQEGFLRWDGYFYAENGGGWPEISFFDGQEVLGSSSNRGYDVDEEGYVYVAYTRFGWGIVKDHLGKGGSIFANISGQQMNAGSPTSVITFKSGGTRFALVGTNVSSDVFDVTNRSVPIKLRNVSIGVDRFAKSDTGDAIAIMDKSAKIKIYTPNQLALGAAPMFTSSFSAYSVTTDGTKFYAAAKGPTGVRIYTLTPTGTTYAETSFDTTRAFSTINGLSYGAGILTVGGATTSWDAAAWKVEANGTLTDIDFNNYFRDYYGMAPNASYVTPAPYVNIAEGVTYKFGGKTYFILGAMALGDVYEIQGGATVNVSAAKLGTANPHVGPQPDVFPGDPVSISPTTTGTPMSLSISLGDGATVPGLTGQTFSHRYASVGPKTITATNVADPSVFGTATVQISAPTARFGIVGAPSLLFTAPNASSAAPIVVGDSFYDGSDGTTESHTVNWRLDGAVVPGAAASTQAVGQCGNHTLSFDALYPSGTLAIGAFNYTVRPFAATISSADAGNTILFMGTGRGAAAGVTWKWELLNADGSVRTSVPAAIGVSTYSVAKSEFTPNPAKVRLTLSSATPNASCPGFETFVTETALVRGPDPVITGGCTGTNGGPPCSFTVQSLSGQSQAGWTYVWAVTPPPGAAAPTALSLTNQTYSPTFTTVGGYTLNVIATNSVTSASAAPFPYTVITAGQVCPTMNPVMFTVGSNPNCSATSPCPGGTNVQFAVSAYGYSFGCAPHTFTWTFPGGGTGTGQSLTRQITQSGTVTVEVKNPGQTMNLTYQVAIGSVVQPPPPPPPPPTGCGVMSTQNIFAEFTSTPANGACSSTNRNCKRGDTVNFSAIAYGYSFGCASHTFTWNFGDGTTGNGQNVPHVYATEGTYPVTLTVNNGTSVFTTNPIPLTITPGGGPIVNPPPTGGGNCPTMTKNNVFMSFENPSKTCHGASSVPCGVGETISFGVQTYGYNMSCGTHTFAWEFGDGATHTAQNPTHTYTSANTFPVKLKVTNGTNTLELTHNVVVGGNSNPVTPGLAIDFSVVKMNGVTNGYTFTPTSYPAGQVTKWMWDFGDGTTRTISKADGTTSYIYADDRSYNVTLKALNPTTNAEIAPPKVRKNEPTSPPRRRGVRH